MWGGPSCRWRSSSPGPRALTSSPPLLAAGNAGMAAAYAARKLGIPATIVVPSTTPALTVERLKGEGAMVEVVGEVSAHPQAVGAQAADQAHRLDCPHPQPRRRWARPSRWPRHWPRTTPAGSTSPPSMTPSSGECSLGSLGTRAATPGYHWAAMLVTTRDAGSRGCARDLSTGEHSGRKPRERGPPVRWPSGTRELCGLSALPIATFVAGTGGQSKAPSRHRAWRLASGWHLEQGTSCPAPGHVLTRLPGCLGPCRVPAGSPGLTCHRCHSPGKATPPSSES